MYSHPTSTTDISNIVYQILLLIKHYSCRWSKEMMMMFRCCTSARCIATVLSKIISLRVTTFHQSLRGDRRIQSVRIFQPMSANVYFNTHVLSFLTGRASTSPLTVGPAKLQSERLVTPHLSYRWYRTRKIQKDTPQHNRYSATRPILCTSNQSH